MTESEEAHSQADFDIIIIGAGISGINAAYRIQNEGPRGATYTILEARTSIGGTWDLFRYPGIRSDSDVATFGFAWNPWKKNQTLASGPEIKDYMIESAALHGIDRHISYNKKVVAANWSRPDRLWTLNVEKVASDSGNLAHGTLKARFVLLATGYYDYDQPLQPIIPGLQDFQGAVIHPQFWPDGFDYTNQDIVVIGSGATAVTLLPSLLDKAKSVTMLQRSPSYIVALPLQDRLTNVLHAALPTQLAGRFTRLLWISRSWLINYVSRRWPGYVRNTVRDATIKLLPPEISWDPHFNPRYNPWDQRVCATMDGDFFAALRSGKANVVTDTISRVTADAIQLESGGQLSPDVIITATGLKLNCAGGIKVSVDGAPVDFSQKLAWKTTMLQDVPNLAFITGYENASWTLGADVGMRTFLRLIRTMEDRGVYVATPRLLPEDVQEERRSMFTLSSTYLKNANQVFPMAGTGQWSPKQNYIVDMLRASWGDMTTGMEFQ
ncbi:hypothetical protein EKO27_g10883 [Xylaria grammica]|uniref:FAD/NAD(P)-binding domain-containing protein n=1 Tax=Xylaria grammica TaxID=363999 RepID=A0A439CQ01_9PEZI|nr:hypothetical protein EKO27_g10883 [Xylaria grammica]